MKCKIDNCDNAARSYGLCGMHRMRMKRRGTTDLTYNPTKCKADDCDKITFGSSGYCTTHYKQSWYLKGTGRDKLIERTSQERWVNVETGYVMVKHNGRLDYEHRVIAEKALGRPLPAGSIVHHTGARNDNHGPFKLVICPDQAYHLLLHKRMKELGYENN